jgi:hypothetical protein
MATQPDNRYSYMATRPDNRYSYMATGLYI